MSGRAALLRAGALAVALAVIIAVARWLSAGGATGFFRALGLADAPLPAGYVAMKLCPSRIRAIEWASGARIEETHPPGERSKWMLVKPEARELAYLDVERWLSKHCEVAGKPLESPDRRFTPYWDIEYVDGSKALLERAGSSGFRWKGVSVESQELQGAAAELAGAAGLPSAM